MKQENDKNVTKLRQQYEREVKELQSKYEKKMKSLRDDLELRRKVSLLRSPRGFLPKNVKNLTLVFRWKSWRSRSVRTTISTSS